jgi:zinc/manganese transport system ATP-binding protein
MLAALLLEEPDIVLLDEPLANLDPRYQYELLQLIEELQKKYHFTLLITAHDFNPLLHLLDRVMFIGEGKAILDKPEKVIQSDVLSELYKTALQVVELNGRKWVLSNEQRVFLNSDEHCHGNHCYVSV